MFVCVRVESSSAAQRCCEKGREEEKGTDELHVSMCECAI